MMLIRTRTILMLSLISVQTACSSGGGGGGMDLPNDDGVAQPDIIDVVMAPAGDITHYGAVTIGDDAGEASDLVGSFFRLASGVSEDFMKDMLSGATTMCQVQDDDIIDFEEISAGYLPTVPGMNKTPVSAGQAIVLADRMGGIYATLEEQPAAGFLFYDLPDRAMLMDGPVPVDLTVNVPGSAEIPAFADVDVPSISILSSVGYGIDVAAGSGISAATQFTWESSGNPSALIRIFASSAGGFFSEDGVTVTCVAPDTGSFSFPVDIQAQLGSDFVAGAPLMSRIVVNPVQVDTTILYVIRESFN